MRSAWKRPCFGHRKRVVGASGAMLLLHGIRQVPLEFIKRSLSRAKRLIEPYQGEIGIDPRLGGGAGHLKDAIFLNDQLSLHLRLFSPWRSRTSTGRAG